jgi:MoxR-like ATPase
MHEQTQDPGGTAAYQARDQGSAHSKAQAQAQSHAQMLESIAKLRENVAKVFLGNPTAIDRIIRCLLARGHILIEDVPGVGKTVLATAIARSLDCKFGRIQLTPDMLPSDVLGVSVYNESTGEFVFKKGPIFANLVLADEINRTTPRTQSALLEAMNESTVTIDGRSYKLDRPFMVIATQNPFEFEGTYLLPENQLDRFLMRTELGYPDAATEARVLEQRPADSALPSLEPVMNRADVIALQQRVDQVKVDQSLLDYVVALAHATREDDELIVGLSPRGGLALTQAARATAVLEDRDYVIPEDIMRNIIAVCAHRIITKAYAHGRENTGSAEVLKRIVESLQSPV